MLTLFALSTGTNSVQSPLDTSGQRVAVYDLGNTAKIQTKEQADGIYRTGVGRRV